MLEFDECDIGEGFNKIPCIHAVGITIWNKVICLFIRAAIKR